MRHDNDKKRDTNNNMKDSDMVVIDREARASLKVLWRLYLALKCISVDRSHT